MDVHPVIYHKIIDPLLKNSRNRLIRQIEPGQRVIDIASGTGQLVRELGAKTQFVTGVDSDSSMISYALEKANGAAQPGIQFREEDARFLKSFDDQSFDVATMSLALHQFKPEDRKKILTTVFRIAEVLFILDYSFPLPSGYKKSLVYFIERMAGKEHFLFFKDYMNQGGAIPIAREAGFSCKYHEISGSGIFTLYRLERL